MEVTEKCTFSYMLSCYHSVIPYYVYGRLLSLQHHCSFTTDWTEEKKKHTKILSSLVAATLEEDWSIYQHGEDESCLQEKMIKLADGSSELNWATKRCIWMLLPYREGLTITCVSELDGLQLLTVCTRKWIIRRKAGGLRFLWSEDCTCADGTLCGSHWHQ